MCNRFLPLFNFVSPPELTELMNNGSSQFTQVVKKCGKLDFKLPRTIKFEKKI